VSRALERVASGGKAVGAQWFALTVPAGHKYEVTDYLINPAIAGRTAIMSIVAPGGGINLDVSPVTTVANEIRRWSYNGGAVAYAGDQILVSVIGAAGANWSAWITYVDVDYTN